MLKNAISKLTSKKGDGIVQWIILVVCIAGLVISVITAISGGLQTTVTTIKTKMGASVTSVT